MKRIAYLISLLLLSAFPVVAQNSQSYLNDIGSTAYGINIPVENGFIDISNGNLHLEFPLATNPQRGALSLNESLVYDSRIWMFSSFGTKGSYHWWPYNIPGTSTTSGGWRLIKGNEVGTFSLSLVNTSSNDCGDARGFTDTVYTYQVTYTDPNGTSHLFNADVTQEISTCLLNPFTGPFVYQAGIAADGSGYKISDNGSGDPIIIDNSSTQVYPSIIDRYGNSWSEDGNDNLMDDTGRIPVITTTNGNTTFYDVLSPNGTIQNQGTRIRYTVTSASVNVSTNFGQQDTYEWTSPGLLTPVQSILLPDGVSKYSFTYDSASRLVCASQPETAANSCPASATGTLPSGVVSYSYFPAGNAHTRPMRGASQRHMATTP